MGGKNRKAFQGGAARSRRQDNYKRGGQNLQGKKFFVLCCQKAVMKNTHPANVLPGVCFVMLQF